MNLSIMNVPMTEEVDVGDRESEAPNLTPAELSESMQAVRALIRPEVIGSTSEYTNRKLILMGVNGDFDGNYLSDFTDEEDGSNRNWSDQTYEGTAYPVAKLVNLPRFIMEDTKPFEFALSSQSVPDNLRVPYDKMLFELGPEDDRHLIVIHQIDERAIVLYYLQTDQPNPFTIGMRANTYLQADGSLVIKLAKKVFDRAISERCVNTIIGFIAEFSVGNTIIGTQPRPKPENVPNARDGHAYRIVRVVMGVKTIAQPWQGGTHASPREHERQGHWRRVKGERRWFDAVTVNKGVPGRVDKAYYVSKNNPSPTETL
jgi:hypothetical protein